VGPAHRQRPIAVGLHLLPQVMQAFRQPLLVVPHRHPVHPGRRSSLLTRKRSIERRLVDMVEQRREPGLARPRGRLLHPGKTTRQGLLVLRPALPCLAQAPLRSGPSLRSARCLRRHRQYYAPIRHPETHRAWPPVLPRHTPPPATSRSTPQGFTGSHDVCAHMTWSTTPAARTSLATRATFDIAFGSMNSLGVRNMPISWLNTCPACLLSTLNPTRPKTRYGAPGWGLPRWNSHPLDIMNFPVALMPGLDPGIQSVSAAVWIAGSSPAMTFLF